MSSAVTLGGDGWQEEGEHTGTSACRGHCMMGGRRSVLCCVCRCKSRAEGGANLNPTKPPLPNAGAPSESLKLPLEP